MRKSLNIVFVEKNREQVISIWKKTFFKKNREFTRKSYIKIEV